MTDDPQYEREAAQIPAGVVVSAGEVVLVGGEDDPASVADGSPATASTSLARYGDVEVGLWEMTPGVMTDVEADEVFVVVSGAATVVIDPDHGAPQRTLHLSAGSVVRLAAGMRTTWSVTETLRKLYVAPDGGDERDA